MTSITRKISQGFRNPAQAAAVGVEVFLATKVSAGNGAQELVRAYLSMLAKDGYSDVLENQNAYAIRLAQAEGDLMSEEFCKLFSLCETVEALGAIGLALSDDSVEQLKSAVGGRVEAQPRLAKATARTTVESWSRHLWCYEGLLS